MSAPDELDNSPAARQARFAIILAAQFARPEFTAAIQRFGQRQNVPPEGRTARAFADFYVAALIDGSAEWKGVAVQATCRALGVGRTHMALYDFLTGARK